MKSPRQTNAVARPADPKGRVDILLLRLGEEFSRRVKTQTGIDLWANGGREFVEAFIERQGIPNRPINIGKTFADAVIPQSSIARRRKRKAA